MTDDSEIDELAETGKVESSDDEALDDIEPYKAPPMSTGLKLAVLLAPVATIALMTMIEWKLPPNESQREYPSQPWEPVNDPKTYATPVDQPPDGPRLPGDVTDRRPLEKAKEASRPLWFDPSTVAHAGRMERGTCVVDFRYWLYRSPSYLAVVSEFVYAGDRPVNGEGFSTYGRISKATALGVKISVDGTFILKWDRSQIRTYWKKVVRKGDTRRDVSTGMLPDPETESVLVSIDVSDKGFRSPKTNKWHDIEEFKLVPNSLIRSID